MGITRLSGLGRAAIRALPGARSTISSAASGRVSTVLGTMSIPHQLDLESTSQALAAFKEAGHVEVDTALMYEGGRTEKALGELGICKDGYFQLACKANPWFKDGRTHGNEPMGGLEGVRVKEQLHKSLESLGTSSVDLFYLHAPDYDTPLEETLQAVHELRQEGLFKEWGVSNYSSWQTVHIWHICR
ncbi:unnamed protein product [Discosporangium mesarthrocarpum]